MKSKKITLEELKTKEVKCISIRTEHRERKTNIDTYYDNLLITRDSICYTKKQSIIEEGNYLSNLNTQWTYSGGNPTKDILFKELSKTTINMITNEKDEEVFYSGIEGTYFSIAFTDGTTIDKDYFVPREEKFGKLIEIIKSLIPQNVETPIIFKENQ